MISRVREHRKEYDRLEQQRLILLAERQHLELVSRVRENRKEYLRLIRVTAAIERSIHDWETLKDTWVYQHIERRGTKRKILDTSSIPVSTVNRELLRFAFNQNEGRLSRREVYDIVERCDGTVAAVLTLLEARMSDYIIVQPSQWATSSEQPTSISDGVNSSGLSTNPFGVLSDTADEEEDDASSNDNYVSFMFAFCLYSHYDLHFV